MSEAKTFNTTPRRRAVLEYLIDGPSDLWDFPNRTLNELWGARMIGQFYLTPDEALEAGHPIETVEELRRTDSVLCPVPMQYCLTDAGRAALNP